jgi:hypothetical protein
MTPHPEFSQGDRWTDLFPASQVERQIGTPDLPPGKSPQREVVTHPQ